MGDPPPKPHHGAIARRKTLVLSSISRFGGGGTVLAMLPIVQNLDSAAAASSARRLASGPRSRSFFSKLVVACALFAGVVACAGVEGTDEDDDGIADEDDGEDGVGSTSDELQGPGPCAGKAIDRAVKCAVNKGARVLSYYRSPANQERVRRENHCTNRCTGSAGCVRPTAGCTSSPHTACRAVDLVADGAPLTRTQLRSCGLAKTNAPHRNHYDLVN
jgi:hypothetical protein